MVDLRAFRRGMDALGPDAVRDARAMARAIVKQLRVEETKARTRGTHGRH